MIVHRSFKKIGIILILMYFQIRSPRNKAFEVISFPTHKAYNRKVMFVLDFGLKLVFFSPQHFYRIQALHYSVISKYEMLVILEQ